MKRFLLLLVAVNLTALSAIAQRKTSIVHYQGDVNIGYAIGWKLNIDDEETFKSDVSRPLFETTHGISITKYAFVGAGVGVQYYYGSIMKNFPDEKWKTVAIPIFANIKGMYPINESVKPFISLSLGGTAIARSNLDIDGYFKLRGGFYCDFGAGIYYKRLNIGLGLQHQEFAYDEIDYFETFREHLGSNSIYLKIGINF